MTDRRLIPMDAEQVQRLRFLRERQAEHWEHMRERVDLESETLEQLRIVEALDAALALIGCADELGRWTLVGTTRDNGDYYNACEGDPLPDGKRVEVIELRAAFKEDS